MTSLHSIQPAHNVQSMFQSASSAFGSTDWFSASGAVAANAAFANVLSMLTPANAGATGSSDPIAQLTALVQQGTPISSIADRLANNIGASLQRQLSGTVPQSEIDLLTQGFARALAPPGNAPPGTPQQQVTALATRLQQVVETLARDQALSSGQQNEISGNILDAASAKEIPAPAGSNGTSSIDVSSIVSSLLSSVASAPRELRAHPMSTDTPIDLALPRVAPVSVPHPTTLLSSAPVTTAAIANPIPQTSVLASGNDPSLSANLPSSLAAPAQAPAAPDTASDLLARMLVRATGVDAKINGSIAVANGASAGSGTSQSNGSSLLTRFEALIANLGAGGDVAASSSSNNTAFAGNQSGNPFDQQPFNSQPTMTHDPSSPNGIVAPLTAAPTQMQTFAQAATAAASPVDANAVIEQMVKSLAIRTTDQGTSEIRLHLQPENLGDVTMKITVTGSQISANVVASSADVRNALVSNHQQLARSLADAGLTLSGFSVDVSGGNAGRDQQNNGRASGFGRRYIVHELPGGGTSETTIAALGPPLLNGPGLALFNYLA